MTRITSDLPPPMPVDSDDTQRITPELRTWLDKGWQAQCSDCGLKWHANTKVGETRCPDCTGLPSIESCFAAIDTMPGPAALPKSWHR